LTAAPATSTSSTSTSTVSLVEVEDDVVEVAVDIPVAVAVEILPPNDNAGMPVVTPEIALVTGDAMPTTSGEDLMRMSSAML
jgi:hypothetical protein